MLRYERNSNKLAFPDVAAPPPNGYIVLRSGRFDIIYALGKYNIFQQIRVCECVGNL